MQSTTCCNIIIIIIVIYIYIYRGDYFLSERMERKKKYITIFGNDVFNFVCEKNNNIYKKFVAYEVQRMI